MLSNKPNEFTKQWVQMFLPSGLFSPVRGQQAGFPLKTDPAATSTIAREWSIPPNEIMFLGDSDVDMITATRAGMLPVGGSVGSARQASYWRLEPDCWSNDRMRSFP